MGLKVFLAVLMALFLSLPAIADATCIMCHGAMEGRIEGAKGVVNVHIDAEKFSGSVHGTLECTDCHLNYSSEAHAAPAAAAPEDIAGLVPFVSLKSKIDPSAQSACSRCHPTVYDEYKKSVHGENLFSKRQTDAPLCLDCHGSPHYIVPKDSPESPVSHGRMLHTCGNCHENEKLIEKYGLSRHVIEKYHESFHGKKYILGHKKVPICNDCHGSHAITKWDAPGSPVIGEGKIVTCGKCHKGATAKFAAAPAHKYIGKENPIPYWGEKILILLLLSVFMFIVSHVVLEAFAEIRDKYTGKGEHHE